MVTDDPELMDDGFEALKFMLRTWSANNIRMYYTKQESLAMTGATSYTIGSGGSLDTVRPSSIRGAWTANGELRIITEGQYRRVRMSSAAGAEIESIWYSPEYPLGVIYPWPLGGTTLYIDSLKPLTDPATVTTDVSFPPEYDDAIKWNLALRLATEQGIEPSQMVLALAQSTLLALETRNFAEQLDSIQPEVVRLANVKYDIDTG